MSDEAPILRPRPRRVFNVNDSSGSSTPAESANQGTLSPKETGSAAISRNGSIMNLTSPTLYGIYSPTAFESIRDEHSPWGTEAEAQSSSPDGPKVQPTTVRTDSAAVLRTRSRLSHGLFRGVILPQTLSSATLFAFGVVYGIITIHLHENHWITPVKLEYTHFYGSWEYLGFWGITGVAIGSVLPWLDSYLDGAVNDCTTRDKRSSNDQESAELGLSWPAVVRSVGAFVGIAFAMRRTPWESTTQASLTLALANPVLWYLIDRSKTGFILSTIVGIGGMGLLLGLKPDLIPSTEPSVSAIPSLNGTGPEATLAAGLTQESVAVRTWVASVLFCACVCFGNIGRQLAVGSRRGVMNS
ncbi:insulin-induced protein-domain-containing protein [Aspergillus cavernicola]|uniref:Insulin-induced protein-domain-containing protein n=1 Tax=Aspergillus cavernicola TaxID=176166 RepID=A0ABR4J085_9EURO